MKHLSTNYWQFIKEAATAAKPRTIDYNKIDAMKQTMRQLEDKLRNTHDNEERRKLSLKIKVMDLRIQIAQIV